MDVYIGFGLLSAAVIVIVFILFDVWLKKRNQDSNVRDNTNEDPEFSVDSHAHGLSARILENVSIPEENYEMSSGVSKSRLVDLCNENPDRKSHRFDAADVDDLDDEPACVVQEVEKERIAHPKTIEKKNAVISASQEKSMTFPPNLLVLSVMAERDTRFESYDLFQAIAAAGLQYGEMNIFHYYQPTAVGKIALFSLASANKPGDFDLNNIAEFSCSGLMLFMDIGQAPDPQSAFKLMLDTAERLAEDLDAVLCSDPMTPWNEKQAWQYHQKIMHYKTALKHENKTVV